MGNLFSESNICPNDIPTQSIAICAIVIALITVIILQMIGYRGFIQISKEQQNNAAMPFVFKYMFYACIIMAIIQFICFLINTTICSHISLLLSFIIYAIIIIHIFLLWLFRLFYTFNRSSYAKSNIFFIATLCIFITVALLAICGLILFVASIRFVGILLIILSAFGYMIMSLWLMNIFARQLLALITCRITTMRFKTEATLRKRTSTLDLSFRDQKLVHCISKYLVLGITSLTTTATVLIIAVLDFSNVFGKHSKSIVMLCLIILIMIDVISNILCIYLQFSFANKQYQSLCTWFDDKINQKIESIAVKKLREKTFTFYSKRFEDKELDLGDDNNLNMDEPEKVPTFSSSAISIQRIQSISPKSNTKPSETDKVIAPLDFDKLINYKTIKKQESASETSNESGQKLKIQKLQRVHSGVESEDEHNDIDNGDQDPYIQ